ncbi:MAG: hypothetical protein AAGD32_03110 [Planctomycetota bacterium]
MPPRPPLKRPTLEQPARSGCKHPRDDEVLTRVFALCLSDRLDIGKRSAHDARVHRVALLFLLFAGCLPRGELSIKAEDPSRKIPAITRATDADAAALFDALSHEDAAVRLAAIQVLREQTGADFGYEYWRPPEQRRPALERWRDHLGLTPSTQPNPIR